MEKGGLEIPISPAVLRHAWPASASPSCAVTVSGSVSQAANVPSSHGPCAGACRPREPWLPALLRDSCLSSAAVQRSLCGRSGRVSWSWCRQAPPGGLCLEAGEQQGLSGNEEQGGKVQYLASGHAGKQRLKQCKESRTPRVAGCPACAHLQPFPVLFVGVQSPMLGFSLRMRQHSEPCWRLCILPMGRSKGHKFLHRHPGACTCVGRGVGFLGCSPWGSLSSEHPVTHKVSASHPCLQKASPRCFQS